MAEDQDPLENFVFALNTSNWHIELLEEMLLTAYVECTQELDVLAEDGQSEKKEKRIMERLRKHRPKLFETNDFAALTKETQFFASRENRINEVSQALKKAHLAGVEAMLDFLEMKRYDIVASALRKSIEAYKAANPLREGFGKRFEQAHLDEITLLEVMARRFDAEATRDSDLDDEPESN